MRRPSAALDASALIGYVVSERRVDVARVERAIAAGAVVSAPNWSEMLHKVHKLKKRTPEDTEALLRDLGILGTLLKIVPFTRATARQTAWLLHDIPLNLRPGLGIADTACLALARSFGVPAITTDDKWPGLAKHIGVSIEYIRK